MYGHVEKLAEEIKKGAASVEGVEAQLWQVKSSLPLLPAIYVSYQNLKLKFDSFFFMVGLLLTLSLWLFLVHYNLLVLRGNKMGMNSEYQGVFLEESYIKT